MELYMYILKKPRRFLLFLWMALMLTSQSFAIVPETTITGKVTSSDDGSPLPGVNITVKGTQQGTITDINGAYTITISEDNAVLVFSYIGYVSQEIDISGKTVIDVLLVPDVKQLGEVVVTALGIKRDERSLGYTMGKVDGNSLGNIATENVVNGLAAKVPGVVVNSTGGTGSSVSIIIRGATSLNGDNQPLFVVDGVPIMNGLNNTGGIGTNNRVDYGNAIADLNPEDIETMTVLKGASAAALYGSRAGHGVILITTKKGAKDKLSVSVTSNTVFDIPYKFLPFEQQFAAGYFPSKPGIADPLGNGNGSQVLNIDYSAGGVGPELNKGYWAIQWNAPKDANGNPIPTLLVAHPNNIKNFFQTGITTTNGVSVSNNSNLISYRLSYSNMNNKGIIPNSDLQKNTLSLNTSVNAGKKLTISSDLDFSRNQSGNRPALDKGANPMEAAYAVTPDINILDMKNYWLPGKEGLQQNSQSPNFDNPYFLAHEVNNSFVRDRVFGNIKAVWQITPAISLMGRYGLDVYNESRETKIAKSYSRDRNGVYGVINSKPFERNADFLATYKKTISDFSVTASIGGNERSSSGFSTYAATKAGGGGLILPGIYTLQNVLPNDIAYSSGYSKKVVRSLYGLVNLGYKDMVYLDVTARNDWSSTLPKQNLSYFYPSASLSAVVSEMVTMPESISLIKLRGSSAKTGNDVGPYQLISLMSQVESWGNVPRMANGPLLNPDLKPESVTSNETGIDLGFFNNRLRFNGSYYMVSNKNQALPSQLPTSSGYGSRFMNIGELQSRGLELTLGGIPYNKGDWKVDLSLNYQRNRTTVVELAPGMDFITLWTDGGDRGRGAYTFVGEQIGDIYDAKLVVVEDPSSPYYKYPILDGDGLWQDLNGLQTRNKIGNFNPNFIMGMQGSVSYKAFTLSFSLDWRSGGVFESQTYRYAESDMRTQRFMDNLIDPGNRTPDELRAFLIANQDKYIRVNGHHFPMVGGPTSGGPYTAFGYNWPFGGVFNPGVIDNGNGTYTENLGGPGTIMNIYANNYPWDFISPAVFNSSFVKLRDVSLTYLVPKALVKKAGLQSANLSVYSRNIILWTAAKVGIDPERAFNPLGGPSGFYQGIERNNVTPWVMPIGFKLNLTF